MEDKIMVNPLIASSKSTEKVYLIPEEPFAGIERDYLNR